MEIQIGQTFDHQMVVSRELVDSFARMSGDVNPMHMDDAYASQRGQAGRIAHGNILSMMVSHLVGMNLPSQSVMLLSQTLDFRLPISLGQTIRLAASVSTVTESYRVFELRLTFTNEADIRVASGKCLVRWME